MPHALVMMLLIIIAAVALTWIVPAGTFERTKAGLVIPGTYHTIPKDSRPASSRRGGAPTAGVPGEPHRHRGLDPGRDGRGRGTDLHDPVHRRVCSACWRNRARCKAGIDRLLAATGGNINVLAPTLMVVIACGSTFLGLISEYLVIIPMMVLLAERLGYDALVGVAIVTIAAKIGYLTSVTNPLPLVIAQPIVGVPVFSGAGFRLATFAIFLPLGIVYLLRYTRGTGGGAARPFPRRDALHPAPDHARCARPVGAPHGVRRPASSTGGTASWPRCTWPFDAAGGRRGNGLPAGRTVVPRGMQGMMLAGVLVGLASAVEIVLRDGAGARLDHRVHVARR